MHAQPPAPDPMLAQARARASAGAWDEVLSLLGAPAPERVRDPEYAPLVGEALMRTGRARDAHAWLRAAEPELAHGTDRAAYRTVVNLLGAASFSLGALDEASGAFERALELATVADDLLLAARATNNLGAIANLRGDRDGALSHYHLAIPVYQRLGQPRGIAECHHNMAITWRDRGDLQRADEHERQAIEYATEAGAPRLAAMARLGRADLALRRGDAAMAEVTARRAAAELATLGDLANEADAVRLAGAAALALGKLDDAAAAFERALDVARTHGHALVEAETLRDRATLHRARGDDGAAERDEAAATAIFARLGGAT